MNEELMNVTEGQDLDLLDGNIEEFKDLEVVDLEPTTGENKVLEVAKFVGKTAVAVGLYEAGKKAVEKATEKFKEAKAKRAEKKAAKDQKEEDQVECVEEDVETEVEETPVQEEKTEEVKTEQKKTQKKTK